MIFETERLILRPWKESDAESLFSYAKDPEVGPIAGWPVHTSVDNSREIIREVLSAEETYAVCLKEDNLAIGSVGLIPPQQSHTKAEENEMEIGYWIGVPFWGQGLIPEAVRRLQKHAFEDLGCAALWCGYYDGNEKSKRCQEKCGFIYHHSEENKPCVLMNDVRTEHFTILTRENWKERLKKTAVWYVHGKGGSAEEAEHYRDLFPDADVIGFDYQAATPWEAVEEFQKAAEKVLENHERMILVANSTGAYYCLNSLSKITIQKAYLISPIADMENMIENLMQWANVTEAELKEKGTVETSFGEELSWEYLCWVRDHPISWPIPTEILHGEKDFMQSMDTIQRFADDIGADVTEMPGGEHWFHTKEQMLFLDRWICGIL